MTCEKVYRSHSPGLRHPGDVVFVAEGADEVDGLRRRGRRRVPAHSGERSRRVGRGVLRTSDVALQRALEASPLFADGSFWIEVPA
jgi:hypothetical protein